FASYLAALGTLGPLSVWKSPGVPVARRGGSLASARTAEPVRANVDRGHRRFTSTFPPRAEVPEFPLVMTKLSPLLEYQPGGGGASAAAATVGAETRRPMKVSRPRSAIPRTSLGARVLAWRTSCANS